MRSEDGSDRPLVTQGDFAPTPVNWFMDPTLSPDGDRVFYTMIQAGGRMLMYISSANGGAPTRVTNANAAAEFPGSVSPDGKLLAYLEIKDNNAGLMLVKTSGQATPTMLRADVNDPLPQWSPTGEWITFNDENGYHLISPDGKNIRDLGKVNAQHLTFSLDGNKLYGITRDKEHPNLFSMDVAGGGKKSIADLSKDYAPISSANPGIRFSLAPDGTCVIYSVATVKSSIWLFEGFRP
jgi:Tol biopolymer transport system component